MLETENGKMAIGTSVNNGIYFVDFQDTEKQK